MATIQLTVSKKFVTKMVMHTSTYNADVSLAQEFQKHLYNALRKHDIIDHEKWKKVNKNWTNREYHVQNNEILITRVLKCIVIQISFLDFSICAPHNKLHVERGLGKYYHMSFDTKLGHGTRAIHSIPCACTQ